MPEPKIDSPEYQSPSPTDSPTVSRLDELAASATTADSGASFMQPDAEPRKETRGRKKGSKNKPKDGSAASESAPQDPEVLPPEKAIEANKLYVKPVLDTCSKVGVALAGTQKAAIGPEVMSVLVESAAHCIHQYLPAVVGAHTHLVVFSLTFSNWCFTVYQLREQTLEEMRREKAAQNATNPDAPSPSPFAPQGM